MKPLANGEPFVPELSIACCKTQSLELATNRDCK